MATLKELKGLGEELGLKGQELKQFIEEQKEKERQDKEKERAEREIERVEREKEREYALKEKEFSLKEKELQIKEREKEKEIRLQEADRALEIQLRIKQLELESQIQLKQMEVAHVDKEFEQQYAKLKRQVEEVAETSRHGSRRSSQASSGHSDHDPAHESGGYQNGNKLWGRMPKLPAFDDQKDDMDSYLNRFERFASEAGWKAEKWALYLSALLKGRALETYGRLPTKEAQDYAVLKSALLRRFELTEEGFKRKFHSAQCETGESPLQFVSRLKNYLQRWLGLAEVEMSVSNLIDFWVKEQFLNTCSKDLATFLRERKLKDLTTMTTLAETYLDAHGSKSGQNSGFSTAPLRTKQETREKHQRHDHLGKSGTQNGQTFLRNKRLCYICDKPGHIAKDCHRRMKAAGFGKTSQFQGKWRSDQQRQEPASNNPNQGKSSGGQSQVGVSTQGGCNSETNHSTLTCKAHGRNLCPDCLNGVRHSHACGLLRRPNLKLECGCEIPVLAGGQHERFNKLITAEGWVHGQPVTAMRDTGCTTVVVKRSLVKDDQLTGDTVCCVLIDGTAKEFVTANIEIDTPFYSGTVTAVCMEHPMYDLIIGNIGGVTSKQENNFEVQAVVTRAQEGNNHKKVEKPLKVLEQLEVDVNMEELIGMQRKDASLEKCWVLAKNEEIQPGGKDYEIRKGLLFRQKQKINGQLVKQLVVPTALREHVLKLGHDQALSGHLGIKKTLNRIIPHFYWPGLQESVTRWCKSCDMCQRTEPRGKTSKVPLGSMPVIDTPFKRVAIDLVGPIAPATSRGHKYILVLIDFATRYPEATALKNIETVTVAEALVNMYTRIGVPEEVLSDQGSQFMSDVMKEVNRLLSMKHLTSTPYHPMCNGLVEKFNGTLKSMLKKLCSEKPQDWDRYIQALLFAYREVPQESLGYSPFELVYGRQLRGPLQILKELWSKERKDTEAKTVYQYVVDLKNRLQETCDLAHRELKLAQTRQKVWYDRRARNRTFEIGDKVLLLLPTDHNKLLMSWKGPFEVVRRIAECDYVIQLPSREKTFHANMLKKYNARTAEIEPGLVNGVTCDSAETEVAVAAVIEVEEQTEKIEWVSHAQTETYKDVVINKQLSMDLQLQIDQLLQEFQDIFTDLPGETDLCEHRILLTSDTPVRSRAYPLPFALRQAVDKELDMMLKMKIIEPSDAAYASPMVVVRKPDQSLRICVNFQNLNRLTLFDPEPMITAEEIFAQLAQDRIFSKFDMSKGFWQIPIKESDRDCTTLICHRGLFRFRMMPFGLVGAPATFTRMMRRLLKDLWNVHNYLDDVLTHTVTWGDHFRSLKKFFIRVRGAHLTLRPSKCSIGFFTIAYLGFVLSEMQLKPNPDKVEAITKAEEPRTKKQLRSFLGLIGYYRMFVSHFSDIASCLTELTKKGSPNVLKWEEKHENAFSRLKICLASAPILRLPDFSKMFKLQTDASDTGLGGVLMQEHEGINFPIAYASRKLSDQERNYAVVERECLAIVWAIEKFKNYLYGQQQFILEVDHSSLQYLNKAKFQNSRVMRWAMTLQPFKYVVHAIPGSKNVCADYLSRSY